MSECSRNLCARVGELLLQFRDGSLPIDDLTFVREHLHRCPPCVGIFKSYEEVVEVLQRLQPVRMPPGLLERMRRKIAEGASIEDEQNDPDGPCADA
ncbi:MAG: zf-HC2 domain-containing protein [Planctomycetota bacterium]|nr:zf-HC2 domain-containing protein [Planctomycetota bacterium]